MNRLELVERVANKHGISKAEADRIVVTIFEEIMSSVTLGVPVTLIGFGTFKAVDCAPRTGRNPTTGDSIQIPATRYRGFLLQGNRERWCGHPGRSRLIAVLSDLLSSF